MDRSTIEGVPFGDLRCVTIARSRFVNKNTNNFHAYQANRLEQSAENGHITGMVTVESPCSSTEESDYKPLSYDSKANFE